MNFGEQDADVFGVVPSERFWHVDPQSFKVSKASSFRNLETLKL
jgi:hypothetical protein